MRALDLEQSVCEVADENKKNLLCCFCLGLQRIGSNSLTLQVVAVRM